MPLCRAGMSGPEMAAVLLAGVMAGTMNAVVGSGSLVSFPALLAVGLPPVTANISNTIGLVLGSVGGAWGYRRELAGQRSRVAVFGILSLLGGLTGGALLLVLPAYVFRALVPPLIGIAVALVVVQPLLARLAARRHAAHRGIEPYQGGLLLRSAILGSGVYGGYFGAAQGILLIGLMGVFLDEDLHRINAVKNVLVGLVYLTAAGLFAFMWMIGVAAVSWMAAGLLALGALAGGLLGGHAGRLIPSAALRTLIVLIGGIAIVRLVSG
jgi:uncharacterized membrane protein YfcA